MDAQRARMIVQLDGQEGRRAAQVGCERYIQAIERGAWERPITKDDNWTHNIEGAHAELAMHKALGLDWAGSTTYDPNAPDVLGFEVRLARPDRPPVLRIRNADKKPAKIDRTFVLLTGRIGVYRIIGHMRGRDALQERWKKTGPFGSDSEWHEVPASELTPLYADDFPHWRPPSAA